MNKASQQLVADVSTENKQVIQQSIDHLHQRLQVLQQQAKLTQNTLAQKNKTWMDYQVQ